VTDDDDRSELCAPETPDNRLIVGETAVSTKLNEIAAQLPDIVARVGSLGMTRKLDFFPWSQRLGSRRL
jgi:hypothetical protein